MAHEYLITNLHKNVMLVFAPKKQRIPDVFFPSYNSIKYYFSPNITKQTILLFL